MRDVICFRSDVPAFAQTPRKLTLQEAEALAIQQHPQVAGARLQRKRQVR